MVEEVLGMVDVKGRWAFITGASRGVGYQTALFMAKQGCNLIIHSRKKEHNQKVLAEVTALGVKAYSVEAELSSLPEVDKLLEEIDGFGVDVDILFNNAGISFYRPDYMNTPIEDFVHSFEVNVTAPVRLCYHFLPKMQEREFGRIINIISGIKNQPKQAAYSASKSALEKFTKDLSTVLQGTNVCMNLTDPGWCRTDLGGEDAPNDVITCMPGIVVGAFIEDQRSGRLLPAQMFRGMSLEQAVTLAECTGNTIG